MALRVFGMHQCVVIMKRDYVAPKMQNVVILGILTSTTWTGYFFVTGDHSIKKKHSETADTSTPVTFDLEL